MRAHHWRAFDKDNEHCIVCGKVVGSLETCNTRCPGMFAGLSADQIIIDDPFATPEITLEIPLEPSAPAPEPVIQLSACYACEKYKPRPGYMTCPLCK